MSLRTSTAIQADLVIAREARLKALRAQSTSLDTGQSRSSVTRANLTEITRAIKDLEAELDEALARERGDDGVIHLTMRRGG